MKFKALSLLSSVALLAVSTPAFAQLSKPEAKMAATVDAEYERSVALLERMVNQNSGTMNFAGVKTVGDMMRAELEPLGFKVEWLDMAKAGRSRAALCNTYCNKCALKARTCDVKPLSGICLKIVTNNMVTTCVARVAGFAADRPVVLEVAKLLPHRPPPSPASSTSRRRGPQALRMPSPLERPVSDGPSARGPPDGSGAC